MSAAPAFELQVAPGRGERVVLMLLGGVSAVVLAAWAWAHIGAPAGPVGERGWLAVVMGAGLAGGVAGWRSAPRQTIRLAWRRGRWWLSLPVGPPIAGEVRARIDLGSWLLLRFAPTGSQKVRWLAIGRRRAGSSWHALRATLFAPGADAVPPGGDEGVEA